MCNVFNDKALGVNTGRKSSWILSSGTQESLAEQSRIQRTLDFFDNSSEGRLD